MYVHYVCVNAPFCRSFTHAHIHIHTQSIEALQAQLQELRQQTTPLQAAQQRREEHLRDREKFQSLLDNLQVGTAGAVDRSVVMMGYSCYDGVFLT